MKFFVRMRIKMTKNILYQCEKIENKTRCNKMVHVNNDIDFYEHYDMELLCVYHNQNETNRTCIKCKSADSLFQRDLQKFLICYKCGADFN